MRLAAKADLSEMAISDLENGFRKSRPHNIAAILCEVCHRRIDVLA
ncbi:hypothetical protein [Mesorhizobium sp. LSJC285A00]|nr:hypothetical protein [Mesorhizobium sp. LSJC285A00]